MTSADDRIIYILVATCVSRLRFKFKALSISEGKINQLQPQGQEQEIDRKKNLGLLSVETRRKISLLPFFFITCTITLTIFATSIIKPGQHISACVDHADTVQSEFSRTDLDRLSFILLAISEWNALPERI